MAGRPSTYTQWCSDGSSAKIVQPSAGQLLLGWVYQQAPPFRFMNWLFYTLDQWVQWFDFISYTPNLQTSPGANANVTGSYPIRTYFMDPTTANVTYTFEAAAAAGTGAQVTIKNIAIGSSFVVNYAMTGADKVEGQTTGSLGAGEFNTFESDGTSNWWQVG